MGMGDYYVPCLDALGLGQNPGSLTRCIDNDTLTASGANHSVAIGAEGLDLQFLDSNLPVVMLAHFASPVAP